MPENNNETSSEPRSRKFNASYTRRGDDITNDAHIYAVATVSNTSSKHKMNFKVTYENVAGKKKGDEANKQSVDFEGARPIWLAFSVPLPGEYKVEAELMDEDGKKIDSKSGNVTVKGAPMTAPADSDDKKSDDKKKSDDEDDD